MKALILAGGMGTRLRSVTGGKPKPMADLLGRPVMEHIVRLLRGADVLRMRSLCGVWAMNFSRL